MQRIVYNLFFYNDTQNRNASVPHVSHKSSKLKQFIFPKIKSCKFRGFFFHQPVYPRLARLRMGHNVYIFPTKNEIRCMYRTWNNQQLEAAKRQKLTILPARTFLVRIQHNHVNGLSLILAHETAHRGYRGYDMPIFFLQV